MQEQLITTLAQVAKDGAFRAGRGRFLTRLLALPRLYQTSFFGSRLESTARANLARASAALND